MYSENIFDNKLYSNYYEDNRLTWDAEGDSYYAFAKHASLEDPLVLTYYLQEPKVATMDVSTREQFRIFDYLNPIEVYCYIYIYNESLSEVIDLDQYTEGKFQKVLKILYQKFCFKRFNDKDIENLIMEYVEELKKFKFKVSPESIKQRLISLRKEKIAFWEALLEEYKIQNFEYDKELSRILTRREKDIIKSTKDIKKYYFSS